jgi:polysaccharide export outer membrane protein
MANRHMPVSSLDSIFFRAVSWGTPRAVFFVLLLALAPGLSSQSVAPPREQPSDAVPTALDGPVARTEYVLGPGDVLDVTIFGETSEVQQVRVTPEGTVVLAGMGVVNVLGQNLDEAERRVRGLIARYLRNVEVHVGLREVRTFKVFVVGQVQDPGVRLATAMTRVSEVIMGRDSTAAEGESTQMLRGIQLRRRTGETLWIDLVRFRQTGDFESNPRLREGDVVVVPSLDESVAVDGRVFFPGMYGYVEGESLADLLRIANGARGFPADAADTLRVVRGSGAGPKEILLLSRPEAEGQRGEQFILEPFDAIYVAERANFAQRDRAAVRGQVRRPGTYPITPNVTTVGDLIEMAGGLTATASLTGATLKREPSEEADGLFTRQLDAIPFEYLSDEERRIQQIRASGDETNVVVDFEDLLIEGGEAYDQVLVSGDEITIPERRNEIAVLGAVTRPGIVGYEPGWSLRQYVDLAGGYSRRADRDDVVVLKAKLGTRVSAQDVSALEPGDKIVVPYQVERTYLERLTAVNAIVSTISATVLAIYTFTQLF